MRKSNFKCNLCSPVHYCQCATVNVPVYADVSTSVSTSSTSSRKCYFTAVHLSNHLFHLSILLLLFITSASRVNCENATDRVTDDDASSLLLLDSTIRQSLRWESLRQNSKSTPQFDTTTLSPLNRTPHYGKSIAANNLLVASSNLFDSPYHLPPPPTFTASSSPFASSRSTSPFTRVTETTLPVIDIQHTSTPSVPVDVKSHNDSPVAHAFTGDVSTDTVKFLSNIFTPQSHIDDSASHTSPLPWTPVLAYSPSTPFYSVNTYDKLRWKAPSERRVSKSVTVSMVTNSPVTSSTRSTKTSVSMSISSAKVSTRKTTPSPALSRVKNVKTLNSRHSDARHSTVSTRSTGASTKPPSQLLSKIIQSAIASSSSKVRNKSKSSRNATHSARSYNEDDEIVLNYHPSLPNASVYNMYYPESVNVYDNVNPEVSFTRVINSEKLPPYKLVWSDEFTDGQVNAQKWMHLIDCSGRGNNELQCYTEKLDNVHVDEGVVHLQAIVEEYNNRSYTSGRLHSLGAGWLYGLFEIRARLPKGKHLWPAIWMVPVNNIYGPWPRSGEIDIMEMRGQVSSSIESTVHFGASRSDRTYVGSRMIDFNTDFSAQYHIYSFEWTNSSMTWFLDGNEYYHLDLNQQFITKKGTVVYNKTGSPFDHPFRIILNVAVGGGFFPSSVYGNLSTHDALAWEKPNMQVDWVRVYQRNSPSPPHEHTSSLTDASKKKTDLDTVHQIDTNFTTSRHHHHQHHTVQSMNNETKQSSLTRHNVSTVPLDISQSLESVNVSSTTTLSSLSVSPESPSSVVTQSTVTSTVHFTTVTGNSGDDPSRTSTPATGEPFARETTTRQPLNGSTSEMGKDGHKDEIESKPLHEITVNLNCTSNGSSPISTSTMESTTTTVATSSVDSTAPSNSTESLTSPSTTTAAPVEKEKGNDEKKINEVINYEYDSTEEKIDSPLITYYYYQEDA